MSTTRQAIHHLMKLVCAFALVLTIGPARAMEAVCVMPNRAVVPMATCGMPCCAHRSPTQRSCSATKAVERPFCCREASEHSLALPSVASLAKFACRCELRPKATVSVAAVSAHEKPFADASPPALLSKAPPMAPGGWTFAPEPVILGPDSGLPGDPPNQLERSRAPPFA